MKHMGKRFGCAALAAQMLLTPAAQAAQPLGDSLRVAVTSHAASCLEHPKQTRETFPQLRRIAGKVKTVARADENTASDDVLSVYGDNDNVDTGEATEADAPADELLSSDGETAPSDEMGSDDGTTSSDEPLTTPVSPSEAMDADNSDDKTTTIDSTPAETPTGEDALLPPEVEENGGSAVEVPVDTTVETTTDKKETTPIDEPAAILVDKPEKAPAQKNVLHRPGRGGMSTFTLDPIDGDYIDTMTLLAIYGFGPDYRVPHENPAERGSYKYNIEDPADPSDPEKGKSWNEFRLNGTENEQWAQNDSGWNLDPGSMSSQAYLYGQTYTAKSLYLNDSSGEEFRWRDDDGDGIFDQYFTGALPGTEKYKNDNGITLPRLPNKEFTNEWYVLGSFVDAGGVSIDSSGSVDAYTDFTTLFTDAKNYPDLVYNELRDFHRFDPAEALKTFEYGSLENPVAPDEIDDGTGNLITNPYAGYQAMMDPYNPEAEMAFTTLPIIGKWKDSTNATMTSLGLIQELTEKGKSTTEDVALYPINKDQTLDSLKDKTYRELGKANKNFDPDTRMYFLRLPEAATELSIKENAVVSYEPGSQVTISAAYDGLAKPVEYTLTVAETTKVEDGIPDNSRQNPARGIWSFGAGDSSIPVVTQNGNKEYQLESITFHVVPPSGEEKDAADYVIHIQRLQLPEMLKDPGNTPMGMIERNVGGNATGEDSFWNEAKKEQAAENFKEWTSFVSGDGKKIFPADMLNNNGGYFWKGKYHQNAWGLKVTDETNVDFDPAAIVVYPNSTFMVPGFSVINSIGGEERGATQIVDPTTSLPDTDPDATVWNVKWRLELTTVDKLSPEVVTDVAGGSAATGELVFDGEEAVGKISLTDHNVKPGVYTLSYTYLDEYDGREHSSGSFDRTVVVLPLHGDVDMDGSVTPADGISLRALIDSKNGRWDHRTLNTVESCLYYFRVCDIDGNGAVDYNDVERLLGGYSSKECYIDMTTLEGEGAEYFYIPLPSGDSPRQAVPVAEQTAGPGEPSVSLKYLGAGNDADALDPEKGVDYNPDVDSLFWMELRLDDIGGVNAFTGDDLTCFTATLTYNNDYVEPYRPAGYDKWGDYILSLNPLWDGWMVQAVYEYTAVGDQMIGNALETGIKPVNTPSKAQSGLVGFASKSASLEARFSVTPTAAAVNRNPLTTAEYDGSVLKLPFRLKKFPIGKTDQDMKLVELAMGPRDFLVTTETAGTIQAALWDNNPVYGNNPAPTNNINLRDELKFVGGDNVKLGKDITPCYYVYVDELYSGQSNYAADITSTSANGKNLVYGYGQNIKMKDYGVKDGKADVTENRIAFSTGTSIDSKLIWTDETPGGYSYDPASHTLMVTPTHAGSFDFTIDGNPTPYRLVVDKAPLTLTVDDVKKYYGETTSTATTFTYDKTQIVNSEAESSDNTGKSADLEKVISGYTAPRIKLTTAVENGNDVVAKTVPGDYTVLIQGGSSDNYDFRYVRKDKSATDKDRISAGLGTAKLTILPRPLLVDKVTKDPAGTLEEKSNSLVISGTANMGEFTFAGVDQHTDLSKYDATTKTIDGVPIDPSITVVSGDKLELSYTGNVIKSEKDPAYGGFTLTEDKEERDAEISSIQLTKNAKTQNGCYELKNKKVKDVAPPYTENILPIDSDAKASIEKRKLLKLEIGHQPMRLSYTYGQGLDMSQLRLDAYFSDQPDRAEQAAHTLANLKKALGVDAFWVDDANSLPATDAKAAVDGEEMHVSDRDGKYLCLMDSSNRDIYVHVGPFRVEKRALTLTIEPATRYYGELVTDWVIGYNYSQLAEWDRAEHPKETGYVEDLAAWMPGYTAPTVHPREEASLTSKPVTEMTNVGRYSVVISGGAAADYRFEYTKSAVSGTEGIDAEFGYAPFYIERRPILVTKILAPAGSMYHDTSSYTVNAARAVAGGDAAGFLAAKPVENTTYYESDFSPYTWDGRWPLTHSAIHRNDTLTILYRGEFLGRQNEQMPFYVLDIDEPSRTVKVQATSLRLTGDRSENYRLLFPTQEAVTNGWAGESALDSQTTGTIYRRKIGKIELSGPNKVDYTYGERLDLTGLSAKITYAAENGKPSEVEVVDYGNISLNGVTTTTFKRLGLILHMGSEDGAQVSNQQPISVAEHNGRYIYVTGPQYENGLVVSSVTPQPLSVKKKKLALTVNDITRKYGEMNGTYEYTFSLGDLVSWDQELVGSLPLNGTADMLQEASTSAALAAVNAPYADGSSAKEFVAPYFSTLAGYNSPVKGSPYVLNIAGGFMANYEFEMIPGKINVEKRPIRVDEIIKDPIYIISENEFQVNKQPAFENVICTQEEIRTSVSASDGVSGEAIISGDNLSLRIVSGTVDGQSRPVDDAAFAGQFEIRRDAKIDQIELLSGGDNDNYVLTNRTYSSGVLNEKLWARDKVIVHRREILSIRVVQTPQKMEYTYGEPLNLRGMILEITYKKGDNETETANVDPTVMRDVYINYWDPATPAPTGAQLNADSSILQNHPAVNGDHLTIAVDNDGFAHNGMHLLVSARPHSDKDYVDSALTSVPIVVKPRELTYTLTAEDKDYDHNRDAAGAITLTNIYGDDEVWVKNGTDYTGAIPTDRTFASGDYFAAGGYDGIRFAFIDENVSYMFSDGHDEFMDLQDIPVEVTGIALEGRDRDNYHINAEVLTTTEQMEGRDGVPHAMILPIDRPAPAVETSLWVDEHTNTVKVSTVQAPEEFGDSLDGKNTLHYEYALVYENELGGVVITDFQDDPYFGGEPVSVDEVDYVPGEGDITPPAGSGQTLDPEDDLFGTREALPRGTWLGALVRIAQTNNYKDSAGQASFDSALQLEEGKNNDAQLIAALEAAAIAAAARPLPEPAEETDRQVERLKGPVIRTYDYRLDLISTTQVKDKDEKDVFVPSLEAVWFTDIGSFAEKKDLDRLVGNEPVRYYSYNWNPQRSVRVDFPLTMSEDILVKLPVGDSASNEQVETLVNPDGTARIYVSSYAPSGGSESAGNPRHLEIIPEALTLEGPGATAQLRVRVSPANLAEKGVTWSSSDEKVVTVSANGLVTAVGPGTATITVTARKSNVSDSITVVVLGQVEPAAKVPYADTMFNSAFDGAFFDLPGSGLFQPERTMTRRELAEVMNRFFQVVKDRVPGEVSNYIDLGDDPRNSAVENLDKWGIVTGVEENIFAPDQTVTRAEMSVILCRMLLIPVNSDPNAPHAFSDARPGIHWAWAYIDALARAGITKGTGDDKYSPERPMTRAELAAFLCRSLATTVDRTRGPVVVPIDVPESHWAYPFILRAVNGAPAVRLIDEYLPDAEKSTEKK